MDVRWIDRISMDELSIAVLYAVGWYMVLSGTNGTGTLMIHQQIPDLRKTIPEQKPRYTLDINISSLYCDHDRTHTH